MLDTLAHYLVPRQSNNHKAKLIQTPTLFLITVFIVLFQGVVGSFAPRAGRVLGYAANISPAEVERLTNVQRQQNGLGELIDNPVLDAAALKKGQDMLAKGYWAHVAPDGTQPWAFFVSAHYDYKFAGENLARDFSDASSAVNAWMASPTHRENMLSPNYKDIGIGVVEGQLAGVDTTIIVQFFGTKLGDTLPIQPIAEAQTNTPQPSIAPTATASPTPTPIPVLGVASPTPNAPEAPLVAASRVTPFDLTRYLSMALVGVLVLVVAVDGFLINRRKIFRIAGHFPAHFAFLGMILLIAILAKAGRII